MTKTATKTKKGVKKIPPIPRASTAFRRVVNSFASDADVRFGKVARVVGLKTQGRLFCFEFDGDLVVRLPEEKVAEMIASGAGERYEPDRGNPPKDWVVVPLAKEARWITLARAAKAYVES